MNTSVVAALKKSPLGAGVPEPDLMALAERLPVVELKAGHALFQAGDAADAAYVLLQGQLEIRAADGTFLDHEGPGALVGEQALLAGGGGARNAAIYASEPALLLQVEAQLFWALSTAGAEARQQVEAASDEKTRNRLSRLSGPFGRLLAASERRAWSEGEALFEEGDTPDGLHVILAGQAEVVVVRDGELVHLSTVYPGRVFGEIATLRGVPRTATVVAREGLRTAFVPAADVLALQQEHPDLEGFLTSLLRSYELPRKGALHQRAVFREGRACVETVYALGDGRELTALRDPKGNYTLKMAGAAVAKEMTIAAGTVVSLDHESRVVGLTDRGEYEDVAGLQALALDGEPLSVQQRRALRKAAKEAELQAPDALICRCLNLQRATLQAAIDAGATTPEALQQATGCGTVCGGCMRKSVPAVLAGGRSAEVSTTTTSPALPVKAPAQLPRMPRLIPWLGNFSFSRDPAGFQRRGHARMGPVFAAHLMGVDFVFVDPRQARAQEVFSHEELDATRAWRVLVGGLLGEALLRAQPKLETQALPPAAARAAAQSVAAHVKAGEVDLLALAGEAVAGVLLALRPAQGAQDPAALAALLTEISSDLSAFGALMPIETPAARRRVEARKALMQRVGAEAAALLIASHRNAQLAVVAALIDLIEHPEVLAELRAELDAAPARDLEGLRDLPALWRALTESIRLRGGGAIWRQGDAPLSLPEGQAPEGALVGAVMELANRPDAEPEVYAPAQGRAPAAGGEGGFFDEQLGARPPGASLPELAAAIVLTRMLQAWDWSLVEAPKGWKLPIVPGMGQPRGAVKVRASAR